MAIGEVITEHLFNNRCEVIRKVLDHFIIGFDVRKGSALDGLLPDGKDRNRSVGRHGHSLDRQIAPCFECFIVGFMPTGALFLGEDVFNRHSSIARA